MKLEDLKVGGIYENDNGSVVYYIVEVTSAWALVIVYEDAHRVATSEFWNSSNLRLNGMKEIKDYGLLTYYERLFDFYFIARDEQTLILE